ncbi:MAG TPA: glutathione S-transferase family protein [Rhizomicrobium sp.]|nr:glutathione S-transferase family protein [Rhizomicrobium sp.]
MALKLYYHPLSSYCWKVLIALYENGTPFEPVPVDLQDATGREAFYKLWPIGKFPVLRDETRDWMIPESSIIIEYLAEHHPGQIDLVAGRDTDRARQIRMRDRFFDLYVHQNMQKVVGDVLRPEGRKDPFGVEQAKAQIHTAYGMLDGVMATNKWAMGNAFTMADCAAAPALFYAARVLPNTDHKNVAAYLERLKARPSFARVLKEAEPYFHMFPVKD